MKFIIASKPTFKQSVTIVPEAGEQGAIDFEFKYIKPKDLADFMAACEGKKMVDILADVIVGWSGVQNEAGDDVPYSRESLELLLGELYVTDKIFSGFLTGLRGAREKN